MKQGLSFILALASSGCAPGEELPIDAPELAVGPGAPGSGATGAPDSAGPVSDVPGGETGGHGTSGGSLDSDDSNDADDSTRGDPIPTMVIDDLEDGDSQILEFDGRAGTWYTYNDGTETGTQWPVPGEAFVPTPEGASDSDYCAAVEASGFTTWGAGLGLDLNKPPGVPRREYDGSDYAGVLLFARGSGTLRFKVQTAGTVAIEHGGTCTEACGDNHGITVELTPTWAPYILAFDEITQQGWGTPAPFDPSALLGLQFQASGNEDFELYIDDVEFF